MNMSHPVAKVASISGHLRHFLFSIPPLNTVKCNVDCAFFNNNTIMGYGLCFRDASGQLMYGESSWKQCFMTTAEAEA
ncbi:eukaryotic translation initiation factor 3 subunit c, partial [Trifolium pratense]